MSKNDMKLIIEGWRHSLKEMNAVEGAGIQGHANPQKKEEINEEELDEGIKEIAFGTILALMGIGDAAAGTISDPVAGKTYSPEVVEGAAQAAAGAAAKNPDNKALQVLAKGLQAADQNPGDTTMGAIPDLNIDVADDVVDYAKHVLDSTEAKFAPDDSEADAPEASGKPDISGMSAPEARKALYDYYRSIGTPGGMTTTRVNNDLRKAGIGQPSDAEREKMKKQQADMSKALQQSTNIREGEPPKVQPDPYRIINNKSDEEIVDAIYNSDQRKNGFFDYYRVQSLMQTISNELKYEVTPYKLVGLRNRLRGMRLDDKGEAVLSYLNDLTPNDEDDLYESAI